jgi:hypothetical protein
MLKLTLVELRPLNDRDRENIAAILKAYREGALVPQPGISTYWYKGVQKENPGPPGDRDEALSRWNKEHGEAGLWIESVCP